VKQPMIVGRPALIVVDMQKGGDMPLDEVGIPVMDGYADTVPRAVAMVEAARAADIPVIFFQEVHRRSLVDFGRELDGMEGIHGLDGDRATELDDQLQPQPGDDHIVKRRYSCFFGTELQILLKGLGVSTLILIGGLTDVCVHYTFADGHQHDYYVRVVEDCVVGSSRAAHDASLNAMEYLQAGARRTTDEILDAFRTPNEPLGAPVELSF
jgi:nicotinamidase-related amidase